MRRKKNVWGSILLTLLFLACSDAQAKESKTIKLGARYTECGTLQKFWRARPILGRWMSEGFLSEAPDFYNASSFPYIKRPYKQEVDLADALTTPRLLGGWHPHKGATGELSRYNDVADADLVYRKADGSLAYRWDLLDVRLTRFIEMGYTDLTLVLDQMPYCFTKNPHFETYGQAIPPSDMQEWYIFIRSLCKELKRRYGAKIANGFRFRLGTELGDGKRIVLTQDQLHEMYAMTHKGIKAELPKAQLGAWNEAGFKSRQDKAPLSVLKLAEFAKKNGYAFDFACVSSYSIPKMQGKKITANNPQIKAEEDLKYFSELRKLFRDLPAECHEFGILNSEFGVETNEPGSRGGAYRFHYLMTLFEHKSLDLLYHWDIFDSVGNLNQQGRMQFMMSNGWLFSILEHAAGGNISILEDSRSKSDQDDVLHKCAVISSRKKSFLIVSSYALNRSDALTQTISLSIPAALIKNRVPRNGAVQYVTLSPEHDIYRTLKFDLGKAGNLKPAYAQHDSLYARHRQMADRYPEAKAMIDANYPRYQKEMEESLTLKPSPYKITKKGMYFVLEFPLMTDSLCVFTW